MLPITLVSASVRRGLCCALLVTLTLVGWTMPLRSQSQPVPGQNINMLGGLDADPFLQKQNEPSIAFSTRNPCHLLAGANDYRTVELPGLPDDQETGDAWVGLYKSIDCGQTWKSGLVPGYPQDRSPEGTASPAKGMSTAADPVVRSGAGGLFFYGFIAFNRGSNVGRVVVARFIDNNNKESGDPIQYLGTTLVDSGSGGRFLDKQTIAVRMVPGTTCTINGQIVPGHDVFVSYTQFNGNSPNGSAKGTIYLARLGNCGQTLMGSAEKDPERQSSCSGRHGGGRSAGRQPQRVRRVAAIRGWQRPQRDPLRALHQRRPVVLVADHRAAALVVRTCRSIRARRPTASAPTPSRRSRWITPGGCGSQCRCAALDPYRMRAWCSR